MAWIPVDQQQETGQSGKIVALVLAVLSVFLARWLSLLAFAEYLIQHYPEGFSIAFLLKGHIWLLLWLGFSLLIFLIMWSAYSRIRCWVQERRSLKAMKTGHTRR